jgi:hypothetical protein
VIYSSRKPISSPLKEQTIQPEDSFEDATFIFKGIKLPTSELGCNVSSFTANSIFPHDIFNNEEKTLG